MSRVPPPVGRYRTFLPRQQLFDSLSRRFAVIDQADSTGISDAEERREEGD
jgi:hypothetical protein